MANGESRQYRAATGLYNDTAVLIVNTISGLDPHIVGVPPAVTVDSL